MSLLYLIDGYNVIHRLFRYQSLLDNLELARAVLVEDVCGYSAVTGNKALVVFDAHLGSALRPKVTEIIGVRVCFTKHGQTADTYIEQFVHRAEVPDNIRVVTSDRLEHMTVAVAGARRVRPEEFELFLNETREEAEAEADGGFNRFALGERIHPQVLAKLRKLAGGE